MGYRTMKIDIDSISETGKLLELEHFSGACSDRDQIRRAILDRILTLPDSEHYRQEISEIGGWDNKSIINLHLSLIEESIERGNSSGLILPLLELCYHGHDKTPIRELIARNWRKCPSFSTLVILGRHSASKKGLDDIGLACQIYKFAEGLIGSLGEACILAEHVARISDDVWAKELYGNAEKYLASSPGKTERIRLACSMLRSGIFDDGQIDRILADVSSRDLIENLDGNNLEELIV